MSTLIHPKHGPLGGNVGTVHSVAYHRNGVGGKGFYCVQFDYGGKRLLAVVTSQSEDKVDQAYVVTMDDPAQGWRGTDRFGDDLWAVIRESKWPHEVKEEKP